MNKRKLILIYLISGLLISFLLFTVIAYNINHQGFSLNPIYLLSNTYLLLAAIIFGITPAAYLSLSTVTNQSLKKDNYSELLPANHYRDKMQYIYFDKNANIKSSDYHILDSSKKEKLNRWLKDHHFEIAQFNNDDQNIRCGLLFNSYKDHVQVDGSDSHNLIIGTSGSGKSYSFMLPMLCMMAMTGESGLCVDIKGELSQATTELFKAKGYKVYFVDFIDPSNSDCWNPLYLGAKEYMKQLDIENKEKNEMSEDMVNAIKEYEILHDDVVKLDLESYFGKNEAGDSLYNPKLAEIKTSADFSLAQEYIRDAVQAMTQGKKKDSDQDFWNEEAGRVLEGYVHLLLETGDIDVVNIPAVSNIMLEGDEVKRKTAKSEITFLSHYLKNYKTNRDISKERLMPYVDSAEQTRKSSRNVLMKHLSSIVTNDAIKKVLSNNSIDLEHLGSQKTMIYLKVHDEKQTYYPLVTLFIKQLWQCLVKEARSSPNLRLKIPFNIMFDEMGQFPSFNEITNVLTAGRSRGVRLTAVVQGFDQLDNAYGKNTAKTIKNNVMNTVYLLSGDYETLEELSKRCGSKVTYRNGRQETERIITTDRLQNFAVGEALIIRQREGAYITNMLPFDKYIFYNQLKDYYLRNIPKKDPKLYSIKQEIQEREKDNE